MLKKKEGFAGQRSIVLPRKILTGVTHNNPLIARLYVTDIGYYPKAQYHYRQRLHGIDQHILIYCLEGSGRAGVAGKKYELGPGSFVIIPAGDQHWYSASEEKAWTIYWVHFKGADAAALVAALRDKAHHHHGAVPFQPRRISLFEDIYACLERGYGNENIAYANVCLYHYIASFAYEDKFNLADSRQATDAVEQSINYMQQNLGRSLSLEELAAAINFSASHYSAIFRKKTGFSPIEYFNHLKIQKACQYLLFTGLRVREIADKLGIADPFYFSRIFNKLMGMSPRQYREQKTSGA